MSKQDNIKTQERQGEAINSGRLELLHDVFHQDVIDHDPAPDQGKGAAGFIKFFTNFRSAFPDLAIAVEQLVADEENVAIAYTVTGTQLGTFLGIAPTGRKVKARGMQIARFRDGRIIERWGSSDELGILKQIGAAKDGGD